MTSKYHRTITKTAIVYNGFSNRTAIATIEIDIYDVLQAFNVSNPATQHAIKKLLMPGTRGHKDTLQDLNEAHQSIARAIELEASK